MKRIFSRVLFGFFLCLLSVPLFAQTPKPVRKTGAIKKHAAVRLFVKAPFTGLKGIAYTVLFTTETGVDGARVVLTGADKVFDALSLQGKLPVLDAVYSVVSIGAADSAKLDTFLENTEDSLFGTHN